MPGERERNTAWGSAGVWVTAGGEEEDPESALFSLRGDVFESHPIHSGGSLVGLAASLGVVEHVPSINLVGHSLSGSSCHLPGALQA